MSNWKKISCIALCAVLAAILTGPVMAGKGNGKGNGGGGGDDGDGSTDTSDPDYLISAVRTNSDPLEPGLFEASGTCKATNPDLKGPGIAYLMFFPEGCTVITSNGTELDRLAIFVDQDESGRVIGLEFKGFVAASQRASGYFMLDESDWIVPPPEDSDPYNDDANFSINANARFSMGLCTKEKGRTTCSDLGEVVLDQLSYEFVSF